jgi:micrococcal nuclease
VVDETVRLIGIDTPETVDPDESLQCGGLEATSMALALTFSAPVDTDGNGLLDGEGGVGTVVALQTDRSQDLRDRYDRALAFVDIVDEIPVAAGDSVFDLGKRIIAAGLGTVYQFDKRFARQGQYQAVQDAAEASLLGSWGACDPNSFDTSR